MEIRKLDPERDADDCVELAREVNPRAVTSRTAWLQRLRSLPERAQQRTFVAVADGRVVGEGYAFRGLFGDDSSAVCHVAVRGTHRRRGIGSELLRRLEQHFPQTLLARFEDTPAGTAFAAVHGFHEVRAETESLLDLRAFEGGPPAAVDIRAVSAIDPHDAYLVDLEATRDMPSTEEVKDMAYAEWRELVLAYPLFAADGSFVAYVDGDPAAVSLLVADLESGRSYNWFTGTRRAYRGRGLGAAVKLASIAWARGNGVTEMVTDNDETNTPMLAINRRLGFRPAGRRVEWVREGTGASPAPPAPAT